MLSYVQVFGALALGLALRTLLPYLVAGLEAIQAGGWTAWPKFEAKYVASFGLAAIAYAVTLLTVEQALAAVLDMSFVAVVAAAYSGQDLARQAIKTFFPKLR